MDDVSSETCFALLKNELQKHRVVHQSDTHVLFVRHPRFGGTASASKNKSLLAVHFEIKGRDWAKRGLSVPPTKKKITLACLC